MITLIHVLGSNIPHHNRTLLKFFNETLYKEDLCSEKKNFLIVNNDMHISDDYPKLKIKVFKSKLSIAKIVVNIARDDISNRFLFHGQFNVYIWLALLFGLIKSRQFWWHVWGADLYEESNKIKFKIFYVFRRLAQKKIGYICATYGDLYHFHKLNPKIPGSILYFPTKIDFESKIINFKISKKEKITILLGNSADPSNRHEYAIKLIKKQFGNKVKIIIPMGYPSNNQSYIERIKNFATQEFSEKQIKILKEYIDFDNYIDLIKSCDLSYLIFNRQQGIGTICLLIQFCIPFVISSKNTFLRDLKLQNIPVFFYKDNLTIDLLNEAKKQMYLLDKKKIDFLSSNLIYSWKKLLIFAKELI
ncbi:TDP-N-acetylfucosamine:lipid II N-acetylfucosaminyltransferase [Candidatus Providencia siddallii]|uniref:TDP-N-acetylfucosamine:lipid II N-acetylfucosaminyltransferase n=1 Tax=Candidatus Providencia siddallii TaxID=1715285 RepID=A0A0M6W771_9GAMM|nr:TDP-N-acetylfucosamine:lipid II N-acetylfucosaminyltransferase [Candidatus Providencia siddallii]